MILVFGSINLDYVHAVPALPRPGETIRGAALRVEPGGKGANQAAAAAQDGAAVALAGAVGDDSAGEAALAGLRALGVDLSRVARVAEPTGIASIAVDPAGENLILVGPGANAAARADQVADANLHPGTTLLLQMEVEAAQNAALIARARMRGARTVLNLAPAAPLPLETLRALDWLVVNQAEAASLAALLGVAPQPSALHAVLGAGVVQTAGACGATAVWNSGTLHSPAPDVAAVDTTGAGDCFAGVFAAALDRGAPVAVALRRATIAAALSCRRPGTQRSYPSADEIEAALDGAA